MALSVNDVDTLQDYIKGVLTRADHHAGKVNEIVLALVGAIVWKKDNLPIKVMEREGIAKNVLWVNINKHKYAFSYNHETQKIEMRKDTIRGSILNQFDNNTSLSDLKQVFETL